MKRVAVYASILTLFSGAALAAESFDTLDQDQDGLITNVEAENDIAISTQFARADVDADGMLNEREYDAAVALDTAANPDLALATDRDEFDAEADTELDADPGAHDSDMADQSVTTEEDPEETAEAVKQDPATLKPEDVEDDQAALEQDDQLLEDEEVALEEDEPLLEEDDVALGENEGILDDEDNAAFGDDEGLLESDQATADEENDLNADPGAQDDDMADESITTEEDPQESAEAVKRNARTQDAEG